MSAALEYLPSDFHEDEDPAAFHHRTLWKLDRTNVPSAMVYEWSPDLRDDELKDNSKDIILEYTRDGREGMDLSDPNGVTVLALNGIGEQARHWRGFATNLYVDARTRNIADRRADLGPGRRNIGVMAINDIPSFDQGDYTETLYDLAKAVKKQAAEGHQIWLAAHSMGGVTAAPGAKRLLGEGVPVSGIMTMGSPVGGLGMNPFRAINDFAHELSSLRTLYRDPAVRELLSNDGGRSLEHVVRPHKLATQALCRLAHANPHDMSDLSRRPDIAVTVGLYEEDGLINSRLHARRHRAAGFAGRLLDRMPGTHIAPLVRPESRTELLDDIDRPKGRILERVS